MKQSPNARKQRGRSASRKTGKSNNGVGNRNEPKVRGNPKQLLEKYKNQAREARQSGDRVMAEYYYQFADHYQRVLNDMGVKATNGRGDDSASADNNAGDEQQQNSGPNNGQRKQNRSRRPRGQNPEQNPDQSADQKSGKKPDAENAEQPKDSAAVDPTDAEQPVEVHPELDLDGTAAAPEEAEKPKRRRAPARRRTPRKAAAETTDTASEAGGQSADASESSGDNEAA